MNDIDIVNLKVNSENFNMQISLEKRKHNIEFLEVVTGLFILPFAVLYLIHYIGLKFLIIYFCLIALYCVIKYKFFN